MILYFNQNPVGNCISVKSDLSIGFGKFERILQEVAERRIKKVAIAAYGEMRINRRDYEAAPAYLCGQICRHRCLVYKVGEGKQRPSSGLARSDPSVFHRMVDELS